MCASCGKCDGMAMAVCVSCHWRCEYDDAGSCLQAFHQYLDGPCYFLFEGKQMNDTAAANFDSDVIHLAHAAIETGLTTAPLPASSREEHPLSSSSPFFSPINSSWNEGGDRELAHESTCLFSYLHWRTIWQTCCWDRRTLSSSFHNGGWLLGDQSPSSWWWLTDS